MGILQGLASVLESVAFPRLGPRAGCCRASGIDLDSLSKHNFLRRLYLSVL